MFTIKKRLIGGLICFVLMFLAMGSFSWAADCKATFGDSETIFKLATGSPGELGMLEELADAFNAQNDTAMCWVKAGSGKSLNLLKDQQVDVVMVHAPAAEKQAGIPVQKMVSGTAQRHDLQQFVRVGTKRSSMAPMHPSAVNPVRAAC